MSWDREDRQAIEEWRKILESRDAKEILEENDLTIEEVMYILYIEGYIVEPEVRPV